MARIVNSSLVASSHVDLSAADRRRAARRIQRTQIRNPLRRVRLGCCEAWVRDTTAVVGDWLWCDTDDDLGRVVEVAE
jgi:hypothetical protein